MIRKMIVLCVRHDAVSALLDFCDKKKGIQIPQNKQKSNSRFE